MRQAEFYVNKNLQMATNLGNAGLFKISKKHE